MRKFETSVQELKNDVLRSVAELAWEDRLTTGILDVQSRSSPAPRPRCAAAFIRSGPLSPSG